MAKPLPTDGWFQVQLCGEGKEQPGKPILQEEIVGTCGVSTEVDAEESLPAGWKGQSEVWQDLSSLYLNRLAAVMEEVKGDVAEQR